MKLWAQELGFMFCGISVARKLDEEEKHLETWLNKGYQGRMQYLERHADVRLDPRLLLPGAKSVISLALNYFPKEAQRADAPKIARYAYGRDYHKVLKKKTEGIASTHSGNVWHRARPGICRQRPNYGAQMG